MSLHCHQRVQKRDIFSSLYSSGLREVWGTRRVRVVRFVIFVLTLTLVPMSESQSEVPAPPSQLQAHAIQALLINSSETPRPKQRSASSFAEHAELADKSNSNKYPLLCPKEGCGSLILKPGIAVFTQDKKALVSVPCVEALISKLATDTRGNFAIYSSTHRVTLLLLL
jgi:hypothetical protein